MESRKIKFELRGSDKAFEDQIVTEVVVTCSGERVK